MQYLNIKGKSNKQDKPCILLSKVKWQNKYIDSISINTEIIEGISKPKYLQFIDGENNCIEMVGTDIASKYSFTISYQGERGTIKGLYIFNLLGVNITDRQYCEYKIISKERKVKIYTKKG